MGVLSTEWRLSAIVSAISLLLYCGIQLRGLIYWESAIVAAVLGVGYAILRHRKDSADANDATDGIPEERERLVAN